MSEGLAEPEPLSPAAERERVVGSVSPGAGRRRWGMRDLLSGGPLGLLALLLAALIPAVGYSANHAFAPLTAIVGLTCLPIAARPRAPSPGIWLLIALVAWALVTYAWSPMTPAAAEFAQAKTLGRITGLKLVAQLALYASAVLALRNLAPSGAAGALTVLAVLLTVTPFVVTVEALTGAPVYGAITAAVGHPLTPDLAARNVARACYPLALLLWPLLTFLVTVGRRAQAAVLGAGAVVASAASGVDAPLLAMAMGSLAFVAVWRFGRTALLACTVAAAIYFIFAPIVVSLAGDAGLMRGTPGHVGKASWDARLHIWAFAGQLILARPLLGWGLDAARAWPDHLPMHTHNAALQLWLELGPIGAGLVALFFAWLFSRIHVLSQSDRAAAAAAAGSAVAYITIGALSFGVWQEWWLALGAIALIVSAWTASARRDADRLRLSPGDLVPL